MKLPYHASFHLPLVLLHLSPCCCASAVILPVMRCCVRWGTRQCALHCGVHRDDGAGGVPRRPCSDSLIDRGGHAVIASQSARFIERSIGPCQQPFRIVAIDGGGDAEGGRDHQFGQVVDEGVAGDAPVQAFGTFERLAVAGARQRTAEFLAAPAPLHNRSRASRRQGRWRTQSAGHPRACPYRLQNSA